MESSTKKSSVFHRPLPTFSFLRSLPPPPTFFFFINPRSTFPPSQFQIMTRSFRLLSSADAAPPPEAITLESDMVVILAALLCALICVVGMLAVARCTCIRRRSAAAIPAAPRGLKKKVVQSLPKFVYAKDGAGCVSTECAICLAEFADGDEIRVLPVCRHRFHVGCVDTWLGSHSSCPSCRQTPVVAKCQKCGRIPAGGGSVADEGQLKAGEDVPNLGNPSNAFLP